MFLLVSLCLIKSDSSMMDQGLVCPQYIFIRIKCNENSRVPTIIGVQV